MQCFSLTAAFRPLSAWKELRIECNDARLPHCTQCPCAPIERLARQPAFQMDAAPDEAPDESVSFAPLRLVRDEQLCARWSEAHYSVLSGNLVGRISNAAVPRLGSAQDG